MKHITADHRNRRTRNSVRELGYRDGRYGLYRTRGVPSEHQAAYDAGWEEGSDDPIDGSPLRAGGADMTPIGIPEIAVILHVKRETVDMWQYRKHLPEPRWIVGGRPAWAVSDIEEWARSTGRLPTIEEGT